MRGAQSWPGTGAVPFGLRYSDLVAEPRAALAALYAYAGLRLPGGEAVDRVLATDSQAGSSLARAALGDAPEPVVDADELAQVIADLASARPGTPLGADTILPGTWRPPRIHS